MRSVGGNEKIVVSTFRMGLPEDSELWESLTRKPLKDIRQLMRRIEEYKRLENDQLQSKGKAILVNHPRWFLAKTLKGFKVTRAKVETVGGERDV